MCLCVCGGRKGGGQDRTEKRGRNQYIFTESPCVAGTETGRKEGGQRKAGKGFRGRKEVGKDGGKGGSSKELFFLSCLSVVSQPPYYSGMHRAGVCMDCSDSTVVLCSEAYTAKKIPQQTENAATETAALVSHAVSPLASIILHLSTSYSSTT